MTIHDQPRIADRRLGAFHEAHRLVWTYEPDAWPLGVLTGYPHPLGNGLVLEHVIVFPQAPAGTLLLMLGEALRVAWAERYDFVVFTVPVAFPPAARLGRLAEHFGFRLYAEASDAVSYVAYRKEAA